MVIEQKNHARFARHHRRRRCLLFRLPSRIGRRLCLSSRLIGLVLQFLLDSAVRVRCLLASLERLGNK